ncbi:hypothetical protein SAMN05216169_100843 [Anoxybacillus pushchinoensis]|uniref:Uncharacterized protein n=1 Tax=Anoxybacillus pushchinoensis TaxID=150248 RepID=A0A1I0SW98_9BACL|nr:hypothetical protein SAMN05216169_100843 [Anoxybacillus pushchinoensis]
MVFTMPVLVIYAFFNRYFLKGISFTGGKMIPLVSFLLAHDIRL